MPFTNEVMATWRVPAAVGIMGMTLVSQIDTPDTLTSGNRGKGSDSGSSMRPGYALFMFLHQCHAHP